MKRTGIFADERRNAPAGNRTRTGVWAKQSKCRQLFSFKRKVIRKLICSYGGHESGFAASFATNLPQIVSDDGSERVYRIAKHMNHFRALVSRYARSRNDRTNRAFTISTRIK